MNIDALSNKFERDRDIVFESCKDVILLIIWNNEESNPDHTYFNYEYLSIFQQFAP